MADMRLPSIEDLDAMTKVVTCQEIRFVELDPENRVKVIGLCIEADKADTLVKILEELPAVSEWFEKSKLWEGRLT